MISPLITVVIVSYNHERFIEKAINSVLAQKTQFPFEICIADDGSTDNTPSIIESYERNHPEIIRNFSSKQNVGLISNIRNIYLNISSHYIALLDGDDEWTNPLKLQSQVTFLNEHNHLTGCFHDVSIVNRDQFLESYDNKHLFETYHQKHQYRQLYELNDAINRKIIPTSSLMFRKSALSIDIFDLNWPQYSFSWRLICHILKSGNIGFLNEVWAVYNNHKTGITKTSNLIKFKQSTIHWFKNLLNDPVCKDYQKQIILAIFKEYEYLFHLNEFKKMKLIHKLKFKFELLAFSTYISVRDKTYNWLASTFKIIGIR